MKPVLVVLCAAFGSAQTATFETASIKPVADKSSCQGSMIQPLPGGGLRVQCTPIRAIITWAYQIQDYQLSGASPAVMSVSWDIMAKSEPGEPAETKHFEDLSEAQRIHAIDDIRHRLQALLADRFQLKLRSESKEQTVYILTIAKKGPLMKEVERSGMIRRRNAQILATGATTTMLSSYLGIALRRPVTDKTGLTAYYAFELNWAPDGTEPSANSTDPSLITAVREQLGLRLEATKGQAESLVIERIEKPSEN
jgi:uncharacterized protein (TIGR03435 family)